MTQGVPTLASGSPACDDILQAAGYGQLSVSTTLEVDRALEFLADTGRRSSYVKNVQAEIWRRHSPETVRRAYLDLFEKMLPDRDTY
jgi:glycosyltransferase involved in cell wall biosynthesis